MHTSTARHQTPSRHLRLVLDTNAPRTNVDDSTQPKASGSAYARRRAERDDRIRGHAAMVTGIARRLIRTLPANVEVGDLIQQGNFGLLQAAHRYRPRTGASFATYAGPRIKGAMLDSLRGQDRVSRATRTALRKAQAAANRLQQRLQREPSSAEVAAELGWSLRTYCDVMRQAQDTQVAQVEGAGGAQAIVEGVPEPDMGPLQQLLAREQRDVVRAQLSRLPHREREVVDLYFWRELKLREIGRLMALSEARICQLLQRALTRLRTHLAGALDEAEPRRHCLARCE